MEILSTLVDPMVIAENLKNARASRSRSVKECAALIGISSMRYQNYENGKNIPSLQELEALTFFFQIPLTLLLNKKEDFGNPLEMQNLHQYLRVRQKTIAAQLKLKREELEFNDNEVAKKSGVNISRLRKFENGDLSLSIIELSKLADALGLTLNDIVDKTSAIGLWQEKQNQFITFSSIPAENKQLLSQSDIVEKFHLVRKLEKLPKEELDEIRDALKRLIKLA